MLEYTGRNIQPAEDPMVSNLFVDSWGSGVPVVLVHGSLATGADEGRHSGRSPMRAFACWCLTGVVTGEAQRPKARIFCVTPTTSPASWVMVPTSWVIPTVASAFCLPLPAVPMQLDL